MEHQTLVESSTQQGWSPAHVDFLLFPATDFTRSVARRSAKCGAIIQLKALFPRSTHSLSPFAGRNCSFMAATSDARMREGQMQFESEPSSSAMKFFTTLGCAARFFQLGREAN
jgi:hypothetical protein